MHGNGVAMTMSNDDIKRAYALKSKISRGVRKEEEGTLSNRRFR